jgi:hypothetical protein
VPGLFFEYAKFNYKTTYKNKNMYQIIKKDRKTLKSRFLIDQSNEVIEFENRDEASKFCDILNVNSTGHIYLVKSIYESSTGDKVIEELDHVNTLLKKAQRHGLEAECVVFALKYMQENPALSINQAMSYGFNEWVK